ncbi:MAG TPA: protein-glutamate O-methyltransferase CheR [Bryobacteraceae bacterium]|nr:protein-glutamate O-methyltransferase CheR [Bryobacteraceae bacterium]
MNLGAILADPDYPALKRFILDYTGLYYFHDKDEDLATRFARRFSARGVATCSTYLKMLRNGSTDGEELDCIVGELTIGETYFFRHREHFDALRDAVFPELLVGNRTSRRIRVWSAGCATGAEPYSLAILLDLELSDRIAGWEISILATDINTEFLARAREARYRPWSFRETPDSVRSACFEQHSDTWVLKPEFRRLVSFRQHNLADSESFRELGGPFDLILCRNVLMYFGPELIRKAVAAFHDVLMPGGWLVVGSAELNIETFANFSSVNLAGVTFYRKPLEFAPKSPLEAPLQQKPTGFPVLQEVPVVPHRPLGRGTTSLRRPVSPVITPAVSGVPQVRFLADRGEWSVAESLGRQLVETEPLNAPAHFTLALILEHTSSCEEAERSLRRAIYLDRSFALAHYHLGLCLERTRRTQGARKSFRNVMGLLYTRPGDEVIEYGDGITVSELKELARMHIELIGGA